MPTVGFVVVTKNYLLNKGLVALINEIPRTKILEHSTSQQIEYLVQKNEPDFAIVEAQWIDDMEKQKRYFYEKYQCKLILFTSESASFDPKYDYIFYESKAEIIKGFINDLVLDNIDTSIVDGQNTELSNREKTILKGIAIGLTNKEIAEKNFISTHTVVAHRKNIVRKLGIKTISGLTVYALINQIVELDEIE